jgi:hypothetical protein
LGFSKLFSKLPQSCDHEESGQIDMQMSSSCVIARIQQPQSIPVPRKTKSHPKPREGGLVEETPIQNMNSTGTQILAVNFSGEIALFEAPTRYGLTEEGLTQQRSDFFTAPNSWKTKLGIGKT